jgi:hypothetical protein
MEVVNKLAILAVATTAAAGGAYIQSSVNLQGSSPGAPQTGHLNITGTATVGNIRSTSSVAQPNVIVTNTSTSPAIQAFQTNVSIGGGRAITADASADRGIGVHSVASSLTSVPGFPTMGVYGESKATSGFSAGVYARGASTDGVAVKAVNTGAPAGIGVDAVVYGSESKAISGFSSANTGTTYGIYGQVNVASSGFGVYSNGDMGASGLKPFRIDHPDDPTNKYLLHYSSESPMPQNFYVGNVTTNDQGVAWVTLPPYFAQINTNFKYQLTVVDDTLSPTFVQVKIGRKIRGNRFMVMSSAPRVEVSWRVDTDRNDRHVQMKRPLDVVAKVGREKGTYQQPELYHAPAQMGVDYRSDLTQSASASPSR